MKHVINVDEREHDKRPHGGADLGDGAAPDERPSAFVPEYRRDGHFGVGKGRRYDKLSHDDQRAS